MTTQPMNRNQADNEIRETFGFVPQFYQSLPDHGYGAAWQMHRDLELTDQTALDNKTKELIGLAMAGHIKCKYCVYFHTQAARAFGANDQEMREALAMGGNTVLFSNLLTGTQVDFERFKSDIDRAIEHVTKGMAPA